MHELIPSPLEPEGFAPFGEVLAHDATRARSVNQGQGWRTDLKPDDPDPKASPALALYRLEALALPLSIHLLERHPQSAQLFAALTVERFVVVAAPAGAGGLPQARDARAFIGVRGQALRYRRGIWHAPMLAIGQAGDMLMLVSERGVSDDCIEHRLDAPLIIMA